MHAHIYFDKYKLAINPVVSTLRSYVQSFSNALQDDFKITCFAPDTHKLGGGYMARSNYPQHYQPLWGLLKYHFRMAVLLYAI